MRYAYYPGCTIETTAVEFGRSTDAVCEALNIELVEIEDWNCCGASSAHNLDHELSLRLPGRNVGLAQKEGLDIVAPCPACYQNVLAADLRLREDAVWRGEMERMLGFTYTGQGRTRHLLEILSEPEMLQTIRGRVKRPLTGLKVVSYYGCVLVRPPAITGWDDPEHPVRMDRVVEALGAEAVDWSYKVDCCGASLTLSRGEIVGQLTTRLGQAAREAGADVAACACGICQINLDTRQAGEDKVPAMYITELMALAFDLPVMGKLYGRHTVDPRPVLRARGLA
ncbi:MAG: CoB--CoM heterodisulfide reductase iron-sulfur subunit B family protein [Anaerolineae bacterium]|nr:CoB--CoM heterodisulfide reductase iron-sulfur subunit B family protein [Anaerolineae bacterium]